MDRTTQRGLTLIELSVALSIVAVTATTAGARLVVKGAGETVTITGWAARTSPDVENLVALQARFAFLAKWSAQLREDRPPAEGGDFGGDHGPPGVVFDVGFDRRIAVRVDALIPPYASERMG